MRTAYYANDGSEHPTKAAAKAHDHLVETTGAMTAYLGGVPELTSEDVTAIMAYIQRDLEGFREASALLLRGPRKQRSDKGKPRGKRGERRPSPSFASVYSRG